MGACAMSTGCILPGNLVDFLKAHYEHAGLMRDGIKQMKKALFGADRYFPGTPYEFGSKDLFDTTKAGGAPMKDRLTPNIPGMINVQAPLQPLLGGWEGLPPNVRKVREQARNGKLPSKAELEELTKEFREGLCGWCGRSESVDGKALLRCGGCKKSKYCNKDCLKAHWPKHKKTCGFKSSKKSTMFWSGGYEDVMKDMMSFEPGKSNGAPDSTANVEKVEIDDLLGDLTV
ncbi:hypothetical protein MBLNU230_g0002t1 [Neophaeotheca triangularis]